MFFFVIFLLFFLARALFAIFKIAASCVSGAVFQFTALLFLCCRVKTSNATFDPIQRDRLIKFVADLPRIGFIKPS